MTSLSQAQANNLSVLVKTGCAAQTLAMPLSYSECTQNAISNSVNLQSVFDYTHDAALNPRYSPEQKREIIRAQLTVLRKARSELFPAVPEPIRNKISPKLESVLSQTEFALSNNDFKKVAQLAKNASQESATFQQEMK